MLNSFHFQLEIPSLNVISHSISVSLLLEIVSNQWGLLGTV